jgi:hypothetical protein
MVAERSRIGNLPCFPKSFPKLIGNAMVFQQRLEFCFLQEVSGGRTRAQTWDPLIDCQNFDKLPVSRGIVRGGQQ